MIDRSYHAHLLALADDDLCMGHRHSEWLGIAPFLEEDLAFASIGQDELGHARALYELVADDVDDIAFGRTADGFRSAHLVELPCTAWEEALVRHWFYDVAETLRWGAFLGSPEPALVGVAKRALREESYHLAHAEPMMQRMLTGTQESHERIAATVRDMYPIARSLFEPVDGETELVAAGGLAYGSDEIEAEWRNQLRPTLASAGVSLDWDAAPAGRGGRRGRRSEYFANLWDTMTAVTAIDPGARW